MDPFAIQTPADTSPVHEKAGTFFGNRSRGYEVDDFFVPQEARTSYVGVSVNPRVLRLVQTIVFVCFAIFLVRVSFLQLARGPHFRALAEGNRIRIEYVYPERGLIFDARGTPLVENEPRFVLALEPNALPRDETIRTDIIHKLKDVVPEALLRQALETRTSSWITLKENLPHAEAVRLTAQFADVPSVTVRTVTRRHYATDTNLSLSHVVGYVGKLDHEDIEREPDLPRDAWIGKTGLEAAYETMIRGTYGRRHIEVDALGKEKAVIAQEAPTNGMHLILGLDNELQIKIEEIVSRVLRASVKRRAAIVALDPRDGEVRALVSLPAFSSNDLNSAIMNDADRPLFPRALAGTYPSGSTIKPFFAAAALREGVITPHTTITSTGGIRVSEWFFPDWKVGGHGPTDVFRAISESVNTFFYYIGGGYGNFEGLGPERLAIWARYFGFGVPTGIDLPGEASGLVPTRDWKERERGEAWYIGDTYHLAIGQGDILVTPLQIANATLTIANGGTRFEPRLVHALRDSEGRETVLEPKVREANFITREILDVVRESMRRTVTTGSAQSLAELPFAVSGKTGTAEWSSLRPPHAWFTGFAPSRNPELVVTVLIEEGGEGSRIAVPIAKEIFAWYFNKK